MSVLTSEAVVLRTWPVHEADLIVSFFTRDYGRVRGVAKSALKSRKRFGGALEPMTLARAWFAERPRQELVRLDQLEILRSPLSAPVDPVRMTVLSFFAELLDEALPDHDPQETVFRLLVSVLEQTTVEQPWMPLTYFQLWMTRLMGLLPDIAHCTACGEALHGRRNQLQHAGRRPVLPGASQRQRQRALRRLLATGAAHVARAGLGLCRRTLAPPPRPGPAPLHPASPGAPPGAQTALRRGAGAAGRIRTGVKVIFERLAPAWTTCGYGHPFFRSSIVKWGGYSVIPQSHKR